MSSTQTQKNEYTSGVVNRLASLRVRWLTVNLLTVVVAVFALLGCIWFLVAATDYTFELTQRVRRYLFSFGAILGLTGSTLLIAMIARTAKLKDLISLLETRFPDFGQRLRTVLDLHEGRFNAPAPMLRVLGNQTLARWETSAPNKLIAYRKLWQWFAIASIVFGLLFTSLAIENQWSKALRRTLGADIPYTVLTVEPGNIEVLEGTDVELSLQLEGRLGRRVSGKWRKTNGEVDGESKNNWVENELDPGIAAGDKDIAKYSLALGKLRESVEYRFETSIGKSETYKIKVRPLVQVSEVRTTVVPPAYTKAATRVFGENEVTALSGSEVSIEWVTTQPLSKLAIMMEDSESTKTSVEANPTDDPRVWGLVLPSRRTLHWRTEGVGIDGTPLEVAKGRLRIREDAAPHITWKRGDESSEVHTLAEVPLQIAVSDDFAVASAQIVLQFADGDERVLAELNPEQVSDLTRIDLLSILPLETLGLSQRDYLGVYAVAKDNCEPNPRTAATDVRFIDIRPLRQKFREQEMMPGEPGGGPFASLSELMKRQRLLINQTRKLTRLSAEALVDQIKNIDRMVQAQSELAGNTAFLADTLVARGNDDVESLRQAEASMLQAADSLAAGTFETALLQELDALRWLVETRNELELILNKNPKMGKEVKAAMASLKMKLRRTRPPTALDIALQLEQVANEQEKIAKQVSSQLNKDEDAIEKLLEQQSELAQTLSDVSTQVAKQQWPSKLIPDRMDELVKSIAAADKMLRGQNDAEYNPQANAVSDEARELAAHIRALNPEEPLESLSALAAMSQQAAKMEVELADAQQPLPAKSSIDASAVGMSKSSSSAGKGVGGDRGRMASRIASRAQTIEDVLANLKSPGNKEASEAAEQLESWLKQSEFSKTLAESKDSVSKSGLGEPSREQNENTKSAGAEADKLREDALDRSVEYAAAAEFMNDLYRQLASPKLEQLRKLEAKARELQQALESSSESTSSADSTSAESGSKADLKELQELLNRAGLAELAEVLKDQKLGGGGTMNYRGLGHIPIGLDGVVQALRLEIQAIIMEQISADRNIPVPQNYIEAVNRYFESIASPLEESEMQR